jgi:hypothetical protein
VFAYTPDLLLLGHAVQVADERLLAVAVFTDAEAAGWVAATKALRTC